MRERGWRSLARRQLLSSSIWCMAAHSVTKRCTRRAILPNDLHQIDAKQSSVLTINGMKVGWLMLIMKHGNDNSIELCYSGHTSTT